MLKLTLKHVHLAFFHQAVYPHQLWFGLLLNPVVALEQTTNSRPSPAPGSAGAPAPAAAMHKKKKKKTTNSLKPQPDAPRKGPQTCSLRSPASLHPSQCPSTQCRELGMQKKTPADSWNSPKLMAMLLLRIQILLCKDEALTLWQEVNSQSNDLNFVN